MTDQQWEFLAKFFAVTFIISMFVEKRKNGHCLLGLFLGSVWLLFLCCVYAALFYFGWLFAYWCTESTIGTMFVGAVISCFILWIIFVCSWGGGGHDQTT